MDTTTIVLQLVLSGVLVGSIYGLIAMGFVITYRNAQVFNIAYGQFAVAPKFVNIILLAPSLSAEVPP